MLSFQDYGDYLLVSSPVVMELVVTTAVRQAKETVVIRGLCGVLFFLTCFHISFLKSLEWPTYTHAQLETRTKFKMPPHQFTLARKLKLHIST